MKATIERDTLLAALGGVRMVSARRGEIPILSHVLIQASKGKLQFRATNLDQTITETVPTVDLQGGVVSTAVVPAHGLYNIIKETPMGSQAEIEIVTHKGVDTLVVRAGRSRFVLPTLPANDYPTMPKVKMLCSFALPSAELHDLLKPIRHAISTEETRY